LNFWKRGERAVVVFVVFCVLVISECGFGENYGVGECDEWTYPARTRVRLGEAGSFETTVTGRMGNKSGLSSMIKI